MKLSIIPVELIDEGERFRKDYGDMGELISDISRRGLIQPLAVKECPDGRFLLLAGGRRLLAMKTAKQETVPVRIYDEEMNEIEMRMVELSENIYRKDLEMKERLALTKEIHGLMQLKYGKREIVRSDLTPDTDPEGWGIRQTAELLGVSPALVVQHLRVAEAMETIPELFTDCRTVKDASRIIDTMGEQIILAELAKRQDPDSSIKRLGDAYVVGDFFDVVRQIPDDYYDIVEVDPPYGINLGKSLEGFISPSYQVQVGMRKYGEVPGEEYESFLSRALKEIYRVMRENSWLIFWFAPEPWQEKVYEQLIRAQFVGWRIPGLWIKPGGDIAAKQYYFSPAYEPFYYMRKGRPILNKQGRINTFFHPTVSRDKRCHPTERPVLLMKEVLQAFGPAGSKVLVPFCGSGNTLIAAHELGMSPLGVEMESSYKQGFLANLMKGGLHEESSQP